MEKSTEPCLLASNLSQTDAALLTALLNDAKIPSFLKDRGSGGYMKLYMGFTIYGEDLYVGQDRYPQAKSIMNDFFTVSASEGSAENEASSDAIPEEASFSDQASLKISFTKSTMARIILVFMALITLAAVLVSYFAS